MRHLIYDEIFAPEISSLKNNGAIPISRELRPDVTQFVINAALGKRQITERDKALIFNFIRRAADAFDDYEGANASLHSFLNQEDGDFRLYLRSLHYFETCVAEIYQCHCLSMRLMGSKFFEKNDGSSYGRLNIIYNEIKHADTSIDQGKHEIGKTVPMWITDRGLTTYSANLNWREVHELLSDILEAAKCYAKLEPPSVD